MIAALKSPALRKRARWTVIALIILNEIRGLIVVGTILSAWGWWQ